MSFKRRFREFSRTLPIWANLASQRVIACDLQDLGVPAG